MGAIDGERGGTVADGRNTEGWLVAAAGFGINLTFGVLYSWSVFAKELMSQWRWTTGESSVPYAVAVAVFAIVGSFAGRAQDRFGPRRVATLGGLLLGSGLLVSALASPDRHLPLVVGFGLLTGAGIGIGFVSTFPAAAKWFSPDRRGVVTASW